MARRFACIDRIVQEKAMQCAGSLIDENTFERLVLEHADKRQSAEAREGLEAFALKRAPAWNSE